MNHDMVLRTRVLLLDEGRLGPTVELRAFRLMASVSPAAYLPKLSRALVASSSGLKRWARPELWPAFLEEAVAAAERMDVSDPLRADVLFEARDAYQAHLRAVGRLSEALPGSATATGPGRAERGGQ
ncbi:hypothetical protein GCM10018781_80260 [Kitasatospora indigofera]|uniref:Uncharacterized protein n=1 Tax=Kitasatospora indigofera TaxID=67307 RepID=A0A918YWY7_9ACTN|nr:hypothetical protein [Kitasatospora indigofera]GHE27625.1 hypothetical protein GCM10018781_80260 [Kitasatospora indigofera]